MAAPSISSSDSAKYASRLFVLRASDCSDSSESLSRIYTACAHEKDIWMRKTAWFKHPTKKNSRS